MTAPAMLSGIRIVDLTSVVFGPFATQILADLGADVIKVEPPSGDVFRYAGRPPKTLGNGACHMTLNRGKRSVVLDLKLDADADAMRKLIATADVFIHNVRGKAIERLGFGYEAVKAIKPDIIYVHCVGFGSDGPYADLQAYDDVIQAASGMASLASKVDGNPRPRYVPSLIADKIAGMYGAYAVQAAIIHKLRTGEGQHVEVPMFEAFTQFVLEEHLFERTFDPPTGKVGYPRQLDPERQPFPTADGYISIVPYTDATLLKLFALLGDSDFLRQERFATPVQRATTMTPIYARIAELTPARTTAEWSALFAAEQLPAMPVRDLADIVDDPHLQSTGFFRKRVHPTEGGYLETQPPVKFSAAPQRDIRPAPGIGADTSEVLAELGITR